MEHRGQQSRRTTERRILVALLCDRASAWIRDASQRQLPTDHDYDGGLSPIREYQSDQPSRNPPRQLTRVLPKTRKSRTTTTLYLRGRSISGACCT
jgi:hypothetical protein